MIEFELTPVKKISVHQISKTTVEDLVNRFAYPNQNLLLWADGVLFIILRPNPTPKSNQQELDGHIHWRIVEFTKLDSYPKTLVRPEGTIEVPVINVSINDVFPSFVTWLKSLEIWEDKK